MYMHGITGFERSQVRHVYRKNNNTVITSAENLNFRLDCEFNFAIICYSFWLNDIILGSRVVR